MKNTAHKMKKSLGQNFLHDESVIGEIINIAHISKDNVIFEIGPGDGALTKELLETGARVIALEIDKDLLPDLRMRFEGLKKFTLIHEDIRRFNLPAFLKSEKITSYKVVANLPYYITSSIIRYFLESSMPPDDMTIMVQKEVAQRICASPGNLSILGISVQYFGVPSLEVVVQAEAFNPVPRVNSAVVHVDDITTFGGKDLDYTKKFFRIVRAGFSAKRKMLLKNLTNSLSINKEELLSIFTLCDISASARAQELTLAQWHQLADKIEKIETTTA